LLELESNPVSFCALTLSVGQQEGHPACKKLGVGLFMVTFDWSFAYIIAAFVTTTCIILSTNKTDYQDHLKKWQLQWSE